MLPPPEFIEDQTWSSLTIALLLQEFLPRSQKSFQSEIQVNDSLRVKGKFEQSSMPLCEFV